MFRLRFTPNFSTQKNRLLEETEVPDMALPREIEASLDLLRDPDGPLFPLRARAPHSPPHPSPHRALQGSSDLSSHPGAPTRITRLSLWLTCLKSVRRLLLQASAVALVASGSAATSTWVGMKILRQEGSLRILLLSAVGYFALNAISQTGSYWSNRFRAWVSLSVETVLVSAISKKILRLSAEAFARQSSGNMKVLITSDVKNVGLFLDNAVRNLIPAIASLIVMTPLLIHYSGTAGIIGVGTMILILPISLGLNLLNTYFQNRTQTEMDQLTSTIGEWVKNVRLVRYLAADAVFEQRISSSLRKFMRFGLALHLMACLIFGISQTWWMVSAAVVAISAHVLNLPFGLTAFFGSLWLLSFISGYFTHLPNTIRLFGMAQPSIRRIATFLSEPESSENFISEPNEPVSPDPVKTEPGSTFVPRKLIFEKVSFTYPNGQEVIRDLTLEIDLSAKLAVIGEVGTGKTTLLKLLSGEMQPTSGRILVESQDGARRDLWTKDTHERFRLSIATVPQLPYVSSDLFDVNIALTEDAEEHEVLRSAHLAELEADLALLPHGLKESLGESGVNLSGGQKQRLNLARAFYSERPFLVLDDPLSAVDTRTEERLMHQITERKGGCILVTHRVAEIFSMDEVLVLARGTCVERGTPKELSSRPESVFNEVMNAYRVEEGADR